MRMVRLSLLLFCVLLSIGGCAACPKGTPTTQRASQVSTFLFFGRGLNSGGEITTRQFDDFVNAEICTRFPDGFTLLDAQGLWSEPTVTYREASKVLLIVHANTPRTSAAIDEIRERYKKQFAQTAVLRMDLATLKVEF